MGTWPSCRGSQAAGRLAVRGRALAAPVLPSASSCQSDCMDAWPPGSSTGAGLTRAGAVLLWAVVLRLLAPAAPVFRSAAGASVAIVCGRS